MDITENVVNIGNWAVQRGLHTADKLHPQLNKLTEEVGELAAAVNRISKPGKIDEAADALGDIFVVITILALQLGLDIEYCVDKAYRTIANRTGETVNGVFIKSEDV